MNRRQRKKRQMSVRSAVQASPAAPERVNISADALLVMRTSTKAVDSRESLFRPYEPLKGVLPANTSGKSLAMDADFDYSTITNLSALQKINDIFAQGYAFPGFSVLAEWAQIPEFRRPSETYAREVTRKWIKIQATGEEDKSQKIKALEAEFERLNVQEVLREAIEQDGFFGRSQIYLDLGTSLSGPEASELRTELALSPAKIAKGSLKRLKTIEPIWSYPNQYNANNPLDPTFYKPTSWFVMGQEIHSSRLLTIVSREMPDVLKPAYAFAGLSLSQMMKPYVENWLRTRQSVSDLIHSFTVWTLKTDMNAFLNKGGAAEFFTRLQLFNLGRDNHGVNAINKESEEFDNTSAPLGSLDKLQAQAQEQQCAPSGLPLVYLTGITPAGLNASSQGEIEVFQDTVSANQKIYSPTITCILKVAQLSLFGEIDPGITFTWNPLKVVTKVEEATIRKTNAETDQIHVDMGVLLPEEVRTRIAGEEDSPYAALDLNVELPEPMMAHAAPGPNEQGLDPEEEQPQAGVGTAQSGGERDSDISSLSLNGAQVSSLLEVIEQVASGSITLESGIAIITTSFPIAVEGARKMFAGAKPVNETRRDGTSSAH
ncbi:MAG: DUF1073 domain-containing protein [Candidimonas sp.]|nr:MAG: DUF1073 domain-containing protein [Candidimonas sp.]TAM26876.1 MAG: DUF1073 domain-containing protein [Candidimonas sp.]